MKNNYITLIKKVIMKNSLNYYSYYYIEKKQNNAKK